MRISLLAFIFLLLSAMKVQAQMESELKFTLHPDSDFVIGKYLHSAFAEVLGDCVYDGIWVGKN